MVSSPLSAALKVKPLVTCAWVMTVPLYLRVASVAVGRLRIWTVRFARLVVWASLKVVLASTANPVWPSLIVIWPLLIAGAVLVGVTLMSTATGVTSPTTPPAPSRRLTEKVSDDAAPPPWV